MKRLLILNVALIIYLAGLISTIGVGYSFGAIMVLIASIIILLLYIFQLYNSLKEKKFLSLNVLAYSLGVLVIAELFLQGYSISIGRSLFSLPGFYQLHTFIGFILLGLFVGYSIMYAKKSEPEKKRNLLFSALGISAFVSFIGYLGFARILPGTVRFIYYSFVFLVFFYFIYFLISRFLKNKSNDGDEKIGLLLSSLMLLFWIVRWQIPELVAPGVYRIALNMGFVAIVVLPTAILLIKKIHFLTIFILNVILVDFYFISYDRDFKYLVNTGVNGCVGYESIVQYPIINDPGISTAELFKAPTPEEIQDVLNEWRSKDFTPQQIKIEFIERELNGDSIKVISHTINGLRHYGLVRIPVGIDLKDAPILLALDGGGADVDVLDTDFVYRLTGGMCRDVLNKYIVIAPSYRGDIVRGKEFCFRSEGYTGDVWLGATEDAASFLEVVKTLYKKEGNEKVIAMGISRGATVALILGGLTDKLDHIISVSVHTDFLNEEVFRNERVGSDFPKIFFTPKTSPAGIRKRMIASSPYYFSEHLPAFEIHQGTEDVLTTVQHTKRLQQRLQKLNRSDSTYRIYYYEGKGHGFDDDKIVCESLLDFAQNE